nr:hypothetical protein [uncultured Draconibacterium sp.]
MKNLKKVKIKTLEEWNPDGSSSRGVPEVGITWYDLKPITKISSSRLNKRKIFWKIDK